MVVNFLLPLILTDDGILIARLTEKNAKLEITINYKEGGVSTTLLDLSELTLEEKQD